MSPIRNTDNRCASLNESGYKQPFWVLANQNYYKHILMSHGIEHFYSFISDGEREPEVIVPDGCVDLSFACDASCPSVSIAGTVTRAKGGQREKGVRFFGVRFLPGYYEACGDVSFKELQDDKVSLTEAWKDCNMFEHIVACEDFSTQVDLFMQEFLYGELSKGMRRGENSVFMEILGMIEQSRGNITVHEIAQRMNYSERRINGIFTEHMGIGVKAFSSISRFQNALDYIDYHMKETDSLAEMAVGFGYYDQAHMTREFGKYAMNTPQKYINKILAGRFDKKIQLI